MKLDQQDLSSLQLTLVKTFRASARKLLFSIFSSYPLPIFLIMTYFKTPKENEMLKKSIFILFTTTALLLSACSTDTVVDDIINTDDSERETIAKKDVIYIIKHTPETVCSSDSFKNALEITMEEVIQQTDTKVINIKDIITSTQTNDVTCATFIPSDITDLIDPICDEMEAVDIDESFDLPVGVELNDLIETSCVVAGDIF